MLPLNEFFCACEHGSDIVFPASPRGDYGVHTPENGVSEEVSEEVQRLNHAINCYANKHNLIIENKKSSTTLHYRQQPHMRERVVNFMEDLVVDYPQFSLLHGKGVMELRYENANKGTAIEKLMQSPPFTGRVPLFIGDDVTDEYGFTAVNTLQGFSYKVGAGATQANRVLDNIDAVYSFLWRIARSDGEFVP